jgi:hypothetical protein
MILSPADVEAPLPHPRALPQFLLTQAEPRL